MGDLNYFEHHYDDSKTQYYKDKWRHGTVYNLLIEEIYPDIANVKCSGENILYTTKRNLTPKGFANQAFDWWKNSSGHNRAMLSKYYKYVGIGLYNKDGKTYTTTKFGE